MIHRPPDSNFDHPELLGTEVERKSIGRWFVIIAAALCIGAVLSGVASALRGWSTHQPHDV